MRSRPRPQPPIPGRISDRLARDPQVLKWAKRLLGDPAARPDDLDEEQLAFVHTEILRRRGQEFSRLELERALAKTTPILAAPESTAPVEDLRIIFEQPEMQRLWSELDPPRAAKGPAPHFASAKAVMTVMAMTGISPHADSAHDRLRSDESLRRIFADLELATERLAGQANGRGDFDAGSYPTALRLMRRVAPQVREAAIRARVAMIRELREMHPDGEVGKRLVIDSMLTAAWCQQKGTSGNEEREQVLRRRTPEAGFRLMQYTSAGKVPVPPGTPIKNGTMRAGRAKAARGYWTTAIVDQATGLPLVLSCQDATIDEPRMLTPLLSDLHRHWPEINAHCIAGDGAYCGDAPSRLCEVDYGIHPIFRLPTNSKQKRLNPGESRDASIAAIGAGGQLICAPHNRPLDYETVDSPSRQGLRPGQSSNESAFRVRAMCSHGPHPCGKPGLRMQTDWSRLTYYPHYPQGNARRYAFRLAMLIRLNGVESLWNRLKAGYHLGTQGANRTRLVDRVTHEALIELAATAMVALSLADQRRQRGIPTSLPPAGPNGPTPAVDDPAEGPSVSPAHVADASAASPYGPRRTAGLNPLVQARRQTTITAKRRYRSASLVDTLDVSDTDSSKAARRQTAVLIASGATTTAARVVCQATRDRSIARVRPD